jgi:hypothetical protein
MAAHAHIAANGANYPPMKLIDMYFWSIGDQLDALKKK